MSQYTITWIEQNLDKTQSKESISLKAENTEDALKQVDAVGTVVEIVRIEKNS